MASNPADHVAAEIRAEMARQRRRKMDLAALLGVSQQSVSKRISGEQPYSIDELYAIAAWLGVPVEHFLITEQQAS